jgi:asparagine synthase (glutamine-hydrolysing)
MQRIVGIVNLDKAQVEQTELNRMIYQWKLQEEECPRLLFSGEVGFACISICNGRAVGDNLSPYLHPNQLWMILFDGRIDNRLELLSILMKERGPKDAVLNEEIVLAAFDKWGLEFPKYLIGDFALAIWDKKENRLICVRDHFGVKPLFYSVIGSTIFFASSPQAILAAGKAPLSLYEERIADVLVEFGGVGLEGVDKTSSFYRAIFRLPPAHMLICSSGKIAIQRYWELQPSIRDHLKNEDDLIETFLGLFEEAVRCRLLASPMAASMLSGGLDTSSIVGIGRKIFTKENNNPLKILAVIFKPTEENREMHFINSVLDEEKTQTQLIRKEMVVDSVAKLVNLVEQEMEPFECLMNLNRLVYMGAKEQNLTAVLDGVDGDVLLSGTGHLLQLWRDVALHTILEESLRADGYIAEYKLGQKVFVSSFLSSITPFAPEWFRKIRKPFRYGKTIEYAVRDSIINRDFAVASCLAERVERLDSQNPRPRSFYQMEFHKIVINHTFLTAGLERYERVASASGIEARHPFTDVRLAEFCIGLPWQLKTRNGWTKYILRRAMEPYLPSQVVWRKDKDSLMWEVNRIILKERGKYLHQATLDEKENLKPYVDTRKLERI